MKLYEIEPHYYSGKEVFDIVVPNLNSHILPAFKRDIEGYLNPQEWDDIVITKDDLHSWWEIPRAVSDQSLRDLLVLIDHELKVRRRQDVGKRRVTESVDGIQWLADQVVIQLAQEAVQWRDSGQTIEDFVSSGAGGIARGNSDLWVDWYLRTGGSGDKEQLTRELVDILNRYAELDDAGIRTLLKQIRRRDVGRKRLHEEVEMVGDNFIQFLADLTIVDVMKQHCASKQQWKDLGGLFHGDVMHEYKSCLFVALRRNIVSPAVTIYNLMEHLPDKFTDDQKTFLRDLLSTNKAIEQRDQFLEAFTDELNRRRNNIHRVGVDVAAQARRAVLGYQRKHEGG